MTGARWLLAGATAASLGLAGLAVDQTRDAHRADMLLDRVSDSLTARVARHRQRADSLDAASRLHRARADSLEASASDLTTQVDSLSRLAEARTRRLRRVTDSVSQALSRTLSAVQRDQLDEIRAAHAAEVAELRTQLTARDALIRTQAATITARRAEADDLRSALNEARTALRDAVERAELEAGRRSGPGLGATVLDLAGCAAGALAGGLVDRPPWSAPAGAVAGCLLVRLTR